MLISILIAYLFMGGSGATPFLDLVKQFETATKDVVDQPERREAVDAVLKAFKTAIKAQDVARAGSVKALEKVGENHAATPADHQAIIDALAQHTLASQATMITLHRDLKAKLSAAEWAAIVARIDLKPAVR